MGVNPERTAGPKRNRQIVWGLLLAIVLIFAVFAFVWVVAPTGSGDITVSRETTYLLGPLNADGTVNYTAALNERFGEAVKPENNAVVVILRALGPEAILADSEECSAPVFSALGMEPLPKEGEYFVDLDTYSFGADVSAAELDAALTWYHYGSASMDLWVGPRDAPWRSEDQPLVAEWLKHNEKALGLLVEATKRSRFFMPRVTACDPPRPSRTATLNRYLLSQALDALVCRGMLDIGERNVEAARRDVMALHRLARLSSQEPREMAYFLGGSQNLIDDGLAVELAKSGLLDGREARQVLDEMSRLPAWPDCEKNLVYVFRLLSLDTATAILREGPDSTEAEDLGESTSLRQVDADLMLRHINVCCDRLETAAPAAENAMSRLADEVREESGVADGLLGRVEYVLKDPQSKIEAMSRRAANDVLRGGIGPLSVFDFGQVLTDEALARLALALAAYRAEHGRYPPTLDELSGAYLGEVPSDPFSGEALRYRLHDERCVLYSVGRNRKDDGGVGVDESSGWKCDDIVVRMP